MTSSKTWTTLAVLDWTTQRFADKAIASARLEAQILVAHALGCARLALYTNFDKPLSEDELGRCRELIKRRLAGESLAYVVGNQEFWGLTLTVTPDVLVPRADTETLVEYVLAGIKDRGAPLQIADLCTGSGAIACALAKELPAAQLVATDISDAAVRVAQQNVAALGFAVRVTVMQADLWPEGGRRFDWVVSNPPYIPSGEIAGLMAEVRAEPQLALDGGDDGLAYYRRILADSPAYLVEGGILAVEHGFNQGPVVRGLYEAAGFSDIETIRDLGKHERVTAGRLHLK